MDCARRPRRLAPALLASCVALGVPAGPARGQALHHLGGAFHHGHGGTAGMPPLVPPTAGGPPPAAGPPGHHHRGCPPGAGVWAPGFYPGPVVAGFPPAFGVWGVFVAPPPPVPPIVVNLPGPPAAPFDPTDPAAEADPLAGQPEAQARAILRARFRNDAAPAIAHPKLERAEERLTVGDRLFRVSEFRRAAERYRQAIVANPSDARPYVRLAQVAVARGEYREAADRLREAQAVEPGWMARARDVQNLFGDPARFARVLNAIESHLQTHPDDRDAWLVLGAELYLTGRADRAWDCFLRLTDQPPDATLAAFLDAARAAP
jgi:hypothetical protein